MRRWDCRHYSSCLGDAARADAPDLPCDGCRWYRPDLLRSQEVMELVVFALFVLQVPGWHKLIDKADAGC